MKRTESLALLRLWADPTHTVANPWCDRFGSGYSFAQSARSHGLAAVRAIRAVKTHHCRDFGECARLNVSMGYHVSEAKRAFRAALNAVGLKTL